MKKIIILFFGIALVSVLTPLTEAASTNICTLEFLAEAKELFEKASSCRKESYEEEMGDVFLFAQKEFSKPIENLKEDKVLSAKQMAQKTVGIYREYKQCLDIICRNIIQSCSVQNTQLDELENFSTCQTKANLYKKIQQISLTHINQENSIQKVFNFLRERVRVFEKKMHAWFVPNQIKLINNLSNFESKVSTLVKSPE